jgi:hypothetical protein
MKLLIELLIGATDRMIELLMEATDGATDGATDRGGY